MGAGRPTTYTQEVIDKARDYLIEYESCGEVIPTVVGLCRFIGRAKSTVYKWVSVDDFEKHLSDNDFCFVHFPCGAIKKCYLNDYRYLGGSGVYWQDMSGDDLPMLNTKFIKIKTPAPPEGG